MADSQSKLSYLLSLQALVDEESLSRAHDRIVEWVKGVGDRHKIVIGVELNQQELDRVQRKTSDIISRRRSSGGGRGSDDDPGESDDDPRRRRYLRAHRRRYMRMPDMTRDRAQELAEQDLERDLAKLDVRGPAGRQATASAAEYQADEKLDAIIKRRAAMSPFARGWESAESAQKGENPDIDWVLDKRLRAMANSATRPENPAGDTTEEWIKRRTSSLMRSHPVSEEEARVRATHDAAESLKRFSKQTEESTKPLTKFQQGMEQIRAGALRRGVATMTSGMMGDSALGAFASAMSGVITSAIAFPIAWAIGDAFMKLPGFLMGEREARGKFLAGGGSLEGEDRLEAERRSGVFWASATEEGREKFRSVRKILATEGGMRGRSAEEMTNIIMAISQAQEGGDASGLAAAVAQMNRRPTQENKMAVVQQSRLIEDALLEQFRGVIPGEDKMHRTIRLRMLDDYLKGNLSRENVEKAMQAAARGPVATENTEASTKTFAGWWRASKDEARAMMSDPQGNWKKIFGLEHREGSLEKLIERIFGWGTDATGRTKNVPGLEAVDAAKPPLHYDPRQYQFQWASMSGMAENMQMMYGNMPLDAMAVAQDKTNSILERIEKNTQPKPMFGGEGFIPIPSGAPGG